MRVEIFSLGLRNFRRVGKLSRGIEKFSGRVAIFFRGWGVDIFLRWVGIFREGLRFSSIV